jgi:hypothetical protein
MNDREHINCRSTNITDSAFTQRLERINYNMANRILQIQNAETIQGSNFSFSPQDFLYNFERKVLQNIGLEKGHLKVGDVA